MIEVNKLRWYQEALMWIGVGALVVWTGGVLKRRRVLP